ncbi:MAG: 3-hydroxyacyl-CoA dehydrogenase NAD-binding domain-containing protein [Bacteroidota bacterium]|nr:3-hydroxyacyl-CoA dehydrogenase NAD-binding domain-containing protein [Bacteroidota bacterium]MDP4242823.1 3-hydroxyacyl-CoA dehydrogenase NAD-binding domain-containing protein [Bacteroidota bacterium]MDP4288301.1 3-hydroxyacyl-CoA dehydrogenase NAD-binding domain-containing protein [Bacteroidota bacterium]
MKTIGIIGAGTMGTGIALSSALAGYEVVLYDIADGFLQRAYRSVGSMTDKMVERGKLTHKEANEAALRIRTTSHFDHLKTAELVIEAAIEKLEIKQDLFSKLGDMVGEDCLLATNTSSLSISAVASATRKPDRVLGLHFFNPAHLMKLVEIVRGHETTDDVMYRAEGYIKQLGKTPVLAKDTPGFIVNRVARNFYGEAFRLLGDGIATHAQIDRIMKANGFAMGPFELMDLIGIDVNLAVTQSVYDQFFQEPRFRPHLVQQKMVEANLLGKKTGRGFYDYSPKA